MKIRFLLLVLGLAVMIGCDDKADTGGGPKSNPDPSAKPEAPPAPPPLPPPPK